jgi:dienelactone hydrolase
LLLIHGDADPQMPFEQPQALKKACETAGRPVQFELVPGGKHGGREFHDVARTEVMAKFLEIVGRR